MFDAGSEYGYNSCAEQINEKRTVMVAKKTFMNLVLDLEQFPDPFLQFVSLKIYRYHIAILVHEK